MILATHFGQTFWGAVLVAIGIFLGLTASFRFNIKSAPQDNEVRGALALPLYGLYNYPHAIYIPMSDKK